MGIVNIVSVSGGKDSTALYLWAINLWGKGFRAVFADTGHEHPVTYNYLRNLPAMSGGPEIEWVKADFSDRLRARGIDPSGNPFLDMMLWKGRAPSTCAQFCTEHVKLRPIQQWLESWRDDRDEVIMFVGIRAGESAKRALMPESEWNDMYDCEVRRPLLRWSEDDVFDYLKKNGVDPNPLYSHGSARVGCYPCIHARKSELANMPDWAWEKLLTWEKTLKRTWFAFGTIPLTQKQEQEILNLPRVIKAQGVTDCSYMADPIALAKWKNENSPSVEAVREWAKTVRGGRQFDMFAENTKDVPSCMSTWGVCE